MNSKEKKPTSIRLLASLSSLAVIISVVYILVAGMNLASTLILVSAVGGLAGPAIATGDGVVECVSGFFEMFIEGIQATFEVIAEVFSSILG